MRLGGMTLAKAGFIGLLAAFGAGLAVPPEAAAEGNLARRR